MRTALAIILGERCVICGRVLPGAMICPHCLLDLPYINIRGEADNPIERLFWWRVPIERASSMLDYFPGSIVGEVLYAIKYGHRHDLAVEMGRMMSQELLATGFFDGIDYLQPVPLHPARYRRRGYNQSECLCRGIAEMTGLPIGDFVVRVKDNPSQTQFRHDQRQANVDGAFAPRVEEVERLRPQHVLFVDDVITTGSTIISCVQALTGQPTIGVPPTMRVSVLSLAFASRIHLGKMSEQELGLPSMVIDNTEFRERQFSPLF